jgi:hypothetical protein
LHILSLIALGGLAFLVIAWLVVSFLSPGAGRRKLEWLAATSMYVTLLAFFSRQLHDAIVDDSLARMFAFGFLVVIFALGLVISAARTIRALSGRGDAGKASATH